MDNKEFVLVATGMFTESGLLPEVHSHIMGEVRRAVEQAMAGIAGIELIGMATKVRPFGEVSFPGAQSAQAADVQLQATSVTVPTDTHTAQVTFQPPAPSASK